MFHKSVHCSAGLFDRRPLLAVSATQRFGLLAHETLLSAKAMQAENPIRS